MLIWKLVSGVLSIVLSSFVFFQSCAAGLSNAMEANGESGGSAGFFVTLFMICGGIISIATRKSKKSGSIAICIVYFLAAILGFSSAGSFSDLKIWSSWCLICAAMSVISFAMEKINMKKKEEE